MDKRIFLIDGSAQMYRAHFAFLRNPLKTSRGEITSAIFGFLNTLVSLIEKERPTHLAIVFDTAEPTFRHKAYTEYKATRQKMPEELVDQLGRLDQVLKATGIPILARPGWEADDVIGTMARQAEAEGYDVFMVTGDKDYQQLVSEHVFLYNPSKEETLVMGPKEVEAHFGVPPERVIDVLALMGDTSDNVPGAAGIGPKTAVKLVLDHGSVEAVLDAAAEMKPGKARDALLRDREQVLMSKELVTIDTHAPVDFGHDQCDLKPILNAELERLLNELELYSLLERIRKMAGAAAPAGAQAPLSVRNYRLIQDRATLSQLVDKWRRERPLLSMDLETTSVDPMRAEIVGASFAIVEGEAWYVDVASLGDAGNPKSKIENRNADLRTPPSPPVNGGESEGHMSGRESRRLDLFGGGMADNPNADLGPPPSPPVNGGESRRGSEAFLSFARALYEDEQVPKTGQNLKYDTLVLLNHGVVTCGIVFDSILAAYIINPGSRTLSIDALARDYLQLPKIATDELIGLGKSQITMREVPVERVCEYACEDADYALRLAHKLKPMLASQEKILTEVELPLLPVLREMEFNGIRLNVELLAEMSKELDRDLIRLTDECYRAAGESFNLNSTKQLATILFDKLKLPVQKKLKTGPSTDVDTLTTLAPMHDLPLKLLEYRTLAKLKSTYVEALPQMVHPRTGRVHTTFSQTVAATGRLASNNPNLQNIPIRTEVGRRIREAFVPGEAGWTLVSADYSQIELRIMAHLSGDERLVAAFNRGGDIHAETAALIYKCDLTTVNSDMRRAAKTVNFGIIYGQTDFGLAQELGIPRNEAKAFRDAYFQLYPGVREFMDRTIVTCRERGFVETILGRQRRIPDIEAKERQVREFAERTAINTPVQGSAADMIKLAMIGIHRRLHSEKIAARMLLQVHDELVFEVAEADREPLETMVREEMQHALPMSVPVIVDIGHGPSWLAAH
ncbi:DNA polymerase I [candidate division KSB1 bacterium]|nr:DNA polymerase I [candidate division KSB1 bacterium]